MILIHTVKSLLFLITFFSHILSCKLCKLFVFVFLSTLGGTGGGSERAGDVKDLLDMEHLQLNDPTNKANKTPV